MNETNEQRMRRLKRECDEALARAEERKRREREAALVSTGKENVGRWKSLDRLISSLVTEGER